MYVIINELYGFKLYGETKEDCVEKILETCVFNVATRQFEYKIKGYMENKTHSYGMSYSYEEAYFDFIKWLTNSILQCKYQQYLICKILNKF